MKLMITWKIHADKRDDVMKGFAAMPLADYVAQQGPKIKVVGRWHDLPGLKGVCICETSDVEAFNLWLLKWNSAVSFDIAVVVDDAEAHATVSKSVAGG